MFFYYPLSAMSTPRQIVSPLCLFTRRALPLDSAHSALDVRDALGNGCFPLPPPPRKSHRLAKNQAPLVLLFVFIKASTRTNTPQVNVNRQGDLVCTSKVPRKKKKSVELT